MEDRNQRVGLGFLGAFGVAFWGYFEWNFVDVLKEVKRTLSEPAKLLKKNEGRPVIATGLMRADGLIEDALFGLKADALKLKRNLKQFEGEWKEIDKGLDWLTPETTLTKSDVLISPFKMKPEMLSSYQVNSKLRLNMFPGFKYANFTSKGFAICNNESSCFITKNKEGNSEIYKPVDGDFQVSFEILSQRSYVSIFGKQEGEYIVPYTHRSLKSPIFIIKSGHHSSEDLLKDFPQQSKSPLYIARLVGSVSLVPLLLSFFYKPKQPKP